MKLDIGQILKEWIEADPQLNSLYEMMENRSVPDPYWRWLIYIRNDAIGATQGGIDHSGDIEIKFYERVKFDPADPDFFDHIKNALLVKPIGIDKVTHGSS